MAVVCLSECVRESVLNSQEEHSSNTGGGGERFGIAAGVMDALPAMVAVVMMRGGATSSWHCDSRWWFGTLALHLPGVLVQVLSSTLDALSAGSTSSTGKAADTVKVKAVPAVAGHQLARLFETSVLNVGGVVAGLVSMLSLPPGGRGSGDDLIMALQHGQPARRELEQFVQGAVRAIGNAEGSTSSGFRSMKAQIGALRTSLDMAV
jgi:hypothetical protein